MNRFLSFVKRELRHVKNYFRYAPIFNVYQTTFNKNALISYITEPFKNPPSVAHTNWQESIVLAKLLKDMNFNIDVVQYDDCSPYDYSKYSLIIGFGDPFVNSYATNDIRSDLVRIYYNTGMHINDQNHATLKRIKEVYEMTGKWFLSAGRIVDKAWTVQTTLPDAMITFGDELLIKGFRQFYEGPIYKIPVSSYESLDGEKMIESRNYAEAITHFYWQGGTQGSIHRSLDLLLEYFYKHPEKHLHIATSFAMEREFESYFAELLYKRPNIHTYGFLSHKSEQAKEILTQCGFVVFPSCSEGTSTSVVNLMRCGLVPVVTEATGLSKDLPFMIKIENLTIDGLTQAIEKASNLGPSKMKQMSSDCREYTLTHYTIENHQRELKNTLYKILKSS